MNQDLFQCHEIRTLGFEEDATAKKLLQDAAWQVQPIMRKRNWTVPLLREFFPNNQNLLGLNVGGGGGQTHEIRIRLRRAYSRTTFLSYQSVLGTMLHELVHNVRSPHDSTFYRILDELKAECQELMTKGLGGTGQGFDAPSVGRLGMHGFIPVHNPQDMRGAVAKAAEDRAKKQRLMPKGPCKLGGGALPPSLPPTEAAAQAALRRAADNAWCPCERLRSFSTAGRTTMSTTRTTNRVSSSSTPAGGPAAVVGASSSSTSTNGNGHEVIFIDLEEEERLAAIIENDTSGQASSAADAQPQSQPQQPPPSQSHSAAASGQPRPQAPPQPMGPPLLRAVPPQKPTQPLPSSSKRPQQPPAPPKQQPPSTSGAAGSSKQAIVPQKRRSEAATSAAAAAEVRIWNEQYLNNKAKRAAHEWQQQHEAREAQELEAQKQRLKLKREQRQKQQQQQQPPGSSSTSLQASHPLKQEPAAGQQQNVGGGEAVIDLTGDDDMEGPAPTASRQDGSSSAWSCAACTYVNANGDVCEMCASARV